MKTLKTLAAIAASTLASTAVAQELMVCESTNDVVMLFSAMDGTLINSTFIDLGAGSGTAPSTPIEAKVSANGEIWVSDQGGSDVIHRWSGDGTTFLGQSPVGQDNMRGMEIAYGGAWISNSGTGGAGLGDVIAQLNGNMDLVVAHGSIGDPFDTNAFNFNGVDGLISGDIAGEDIVFFDPANPAAGATIIHDSDGITGIDFPEQVTVKGSNGNILAVGFSTPSGIYEYDASTGAEISYIDTSALGFGGLRGIAELTNGNYLITSGSGVHVYDTTLGTITTILPGVSARFISPRDPGTPAITPLCDPGALNSSGVASSLTGTLNSGALHLECAGGPVSELGYFLVGDLANTTPIALGNGFLCIAGGQLGRYNVSTGSGNLNSVCSFDANGVMQNLVSTSASGSGYDVPATLPITGSPMIMSGETWYFQAWHRDTPAGPGQSNLSNAICVTF